MQWFILQLGGFKHEELSMKHYRRSGSNEQPGTVSNHSRITKPRVLHILPGASSTQKRAASLRFAIYS